MKRTAAIVAFAWAVITLCACLRCTPTDELAGGSSTEGGNVSGVVVYPQRTPVADARVLLIPRDFAADTVGASDARVCSTTTAGNGTFVIDSVEPGEYAVLVYATDGGAKADPVWVMEAQTTDLDTLVIAPYGGVSGRVEVVAGPPELVTATVLGTFQWTRATADSSFTLLSLPPGEYGLVVACPGSIEPPETLTVTIEAGKLLQIPDKLVFHLEYLYGMLAQVDTVVLYDSELPVEVSVVLYYDTTGSDTPQVSWRLGTQSLEGELRDGKYATVSISDAMLSSTPTMLEL
ncbi:MAG: hypothetical protein GF331_10780 [Chitinivibrionales bacterium]|nr:hypothetical protein [Chitinivibrionales bacterium]